MDKPERYEYEHTTFRAGLTVSVDPAIRLIHPESLVAGLVGKTCKGTWYKNLEPFEDQSKSVLVEFPGIGRYYIEEEYVRIDQAEEKSANRDTAWDCVKISHPLPHCGRVGFQTSEIKEGRLK